MRAERDGMNEEVLYIFRYFGLRALNFFAHEMQVWFDTVVLAQEEIFVTVHEVLYVLIALGRNGDDRRCLTRNGVAHIAAIDRSETCFEVGYRIFEETEEQFDGIRTLEMDVAARVTAFASFDRNAQSDVAFFDLHRLELESSFGINTSGATYV